MRYFKAGMIHDNHMKLEESTAHDEICAQECHKKTTNNSGNVECQESATP